MFTRPIIQLSGNYSSLRKTSVEGKEMIFVRAMYVHNLFLHLLTILLRYAHFFAGTRLGYFRSAIITNVALFGPTKISVMGEFTPLARSSS